MSDKCKHESFSGFLNPRTQCQYRASTEAGYCKKHDPDILKAKRDKREIKWREERRESDYNRRVAQYKDKAWDVLVDIAFDELKHGPASQYIEGLDAIKKEK